MSAVLPCSDVCLLSLSLSLEEKKHWVGGLYKYILTKPSHDSLFLSDHSSVEL